MFDAWRIFRLLCLTFVALTICLCLVWVFGLFAPCVGFCVWCMIAWVLRVCCLLCLVVLSVVFVNSVVMILSLFIWCYLRVVLGASGVAVWLCGLCFGDCLYFLRCVFISWLL